MAYVSTDGTVFQNEPWLRRIVSFFLGIFYMFFMLFKSFVSPVLEMFGPSSGDSCSRDSYSRSSGPDSGPPRPPRRMGRPNTGSNIYTPGPMGGCGCG